MEFSSPFWYLEEIFSSLASVPFTVRFLRVLEQLDSLKTGHNLTSSWSLVSEIEFSCK